LRYLDRSSRDGPRLALQGVYGGQETYSLPSSWLLFHGNPSIANSNGAAFAADQETAIQSAISEVIERHHFMSCWLRRSDAAPLEETTLTQELTARYLPERPVDLAWYILGTHFKLVSVLCVAYSPIAPYLSLGAGCRSNLKRAMAKALIEALATRMLWTSWIARVGRTEFCKTGDRYRQETDPLALGLFEMGYLWAADRDAPDRVAACLRRGEGGTAPIIAPDKFFYCDITPPAISQKVVKVIHADALPLPSCHAHLLALGRLVGEDNPMPIPFA
jgi:YcaO cyclodehydratase, ATP-ad Mg2+-binding